MGKPVEVGDLIPLGERARRSRRIQTPKEYTIEKRV